MKARERVRVRVRVRDWVRTRARVKAWVRFRVRVRVRARLRVWFRVRLARAHVPAVEGKAVRHLGGGQQLGSLPGHTLRKLPGGVALALVVAHHVHGRHPLRRTARHQQPLLPSVGVVGHRDDAAALREGGVGLLVRVSVRVRVRV